MIWKLATGLFAGRNSFNIPLRDLCLEGRVLVRTGVIYQQLTNQSHVKNLNLRPFILNTRPWRAQERSGSTHSTGEVSGKETLRCESDSRKKHSSSYTVGTSTKCRLCVPKITSRIASIETVYFAFGCLDR